MSRSVDTDTREMESALESMGFGRSYARRSIKRNYPDREPTFDLLIEIIRRLQEKDKISANGIRQSASQPVSGQDSRSVPIQPVIFQPGEIVYYSTPLALVQVVRAEVIGIHGPTAVEISYPHSASMFERLREIVNASCLRKIEDESDHPGFKEENHSAADSTTIDQSSSGFRPFLTKEEVSRLSVGDYIDHRDEVGRYVNAKIIEKKGKMVKIHYIGWSRKWDCFGDLEKESNRFYRSQSVSNQPAHRFTHLKKGDFVDIHPKLRHPGEWFIGEIRRFDQKGWQVQVAYQKGSKINLYWAHLDDDSEIDEFTKHSGAHQTAQMKVLDEIMDEEKHKAAKLRRKEERKRLREQKKERKKQLWQHKSDKDQRETLRKLREKRFPLLTPDEVISNPFTTGDWLEVQDAKTNQWIPAIVMDSCNNWIVVHYDGFSAKYDQRVHVIEMKDHLRRLSSALESMEFPSHLTREQLSKLSVDDRVDHRERNGRYRNAKIMERKGSMVKIHYIGQDQKYDCFSDLDRETDRFYTMKSVSKRPANRMNHLEKGDCVYLYPELRPGVGWVPAEIHELDEQSGQIQVCYVSNESGGSDQSCQYYWVHLDNEREIQPFGVEHAQSETGEE